MSTIVAMDTKKCILPVPRRVARANPMLKKKMTVETRANRTLQRKSI